jgi:hypothetical protein
LTISNAGYKLPLVRNSANESWFPVIWLKRILPLVIIGLGVGGYVLWDKWSSERKALEERELALVTAQIWVATAKYRNEPEKFMHYRDSLLQATGVLRQRVLDFLKTREAEPEELFPFALKVQKLVDSLARVEDSIIKVEIKRVEDSVRVANPDSALGSHGGRTRVLKKDKVRLQ